MEGERGNGSEDAMASAHTHVVIVAIAGAACGRLDDPVSYKARFPRP